MLTLSDIERALAHYNTGAARACRAAPHGIVNETAFVDTGAGLGRAPGGLVALGVYDGPLRPERAAPLLAAYEETSALSAAERAALPVLVETVWLQGNLRRVLLTSEAEPDYHLEVLEQGRWLSGWLAAGRAALFG